MASGTSKVVTKYLLPAQATIGNQNYKTNPNKNSNDLVFYVVLNGMLIFFLIMGLLDATIIESADWLLNFLGFKFIGQFLLFLLVIVVDGCLVFLTRNLNAINGGIISLLIYYALDYWWLSKEYTDFSLLTFFGG